MRATSYYIIHHYVHLHISTLSPSGSQGKLTQKIISKEFFNSRHQKTKKIKKAFSLYQHVAYSHNRVTMIVDVSHLKTRMIILKIISENKKEKVLF